MGGTYIEHFTRASLPGGPAGSVAFALSSCTDAGAGSLILSGGPQPQNVTCPTVPLVSANGYEGGFSGSRTTWTLAGDVTGTGQFRVRLGVIDVPLEIAPTPPRSPRVSVPSGASRRPDAVRPESLPVTGSGPTEALVGLALLGCSLLLRRRGVPISV